MSTKLRKGRADLRRDMVLDAAEDYVDLSWYIHEVRKALGISDGHEIMSETADAIRDLLSAGYIRAGYLTGEGFEAWDESPDGVRDRLIAEWLKMGRTPEMWEVAWFEATPKGKDYAKRAGE